MTKFLDDVKETIEFLQVDKVILVGHDWGGAIASWFAAVHPNMVSKLVLLNTPIGPLFMKLQNSKLRQFLSSWYIYFFQLPYFPETILKMGGYQSLENCFKKAINDNLMSREELELRKFYFDMPGSDYQNYINFFKKTKLYLYSYK